MPDELELHTEIELLRVLRMPVAVIAGDDSLDEGWLTHTFLRMRGGMGGGA